MSNVNLDDAYIKLIKDQQIYQDDLQDSVSVILRECAIALSVSRTSMWLLSEDQSEISCFSCYDSSTDQFEQGITVTKESSPGYFNEFLNSRTVEVIDTTLDPRTSQSKSSYLESNSVRSFLDGVILGLGRDSQLQGILSTEMIDVARNWTAQERMFVASVADLLSHFLTTHELELSRAKYRSLYKNATEGVFVFSNSKFSDINPAICQMFGGTRDQIIGLTPADLSPKYQPNGQLSAPQAMAYNQACLDGTAQIFEWRHTRLDGTEFDCEVSLNSVNLAGEDTLFALVRDITSKKQAAELARQNFELEIAKKEAEEVAKSKMDFLANMSHEIRTPMNGIFGMVSLVLDTPLNSEQKDYVETIQSSTESLLTILNDILEYSKLSSAKIVIEQREFNSRDLIKDIVRTFKNLAENRGLSLESMVDPNIPKLLLGDDHRIRQIISNLIGNAVKFTIKGGVSINVSYRTQNDLEHCIRFSISDTGIGMNKETIEKLFQPFTQADASITRNFGGTGLGLAICRDLASAMDGTISVESRTGLGTSFHFDVCLQESKQQNANFGKIGATDRLPTLSDLTDDRTYTNEPILIVEDHPINQQVTSSILQKLGYPVSIANNGQEAVDLCKRYNYSIILMDLSMPKMDGFEAAEKIRLQETGGMRATIIAVTGHAFIEHRQRCEEVGIDDFLTKPYNLFKLKEKLDYHSRDNLNK